RNIFTISKLFGYILFAWTLLNAPSYFRFIHPAMPLFLIYLLMGIIADVSVEFFAPISPIIVWLSILQLIVSFFVFSNLFLHRSFRLITIKSFAFFGGISAVMMILGVTHTDLSELDVNLYGRRSAFGVDPNLMAATWASLNFHERLTKRARSPLLTLLLSLLLGLLLARECTRAEHFRFEPGRHIYPVGAVEFLERHPARVIFNSNQFGGYLVFRHQKPFFHSVMSAIADPLLRDYFALRQNPERLGEMVSRYGLDAFLLHYEYFDDLSRLIAALDQSPDWDLVYFDDVAVLYMPSRLGLPAYRALHPGRPDPLGPDPLAARAELERYLAESPGVARGWLLWAVLGERTGDAAMQAEGYQKVLELAPDTVQARLGRARLRFAASDFAGAAEDAREAVRLAPGYAPARFNLAVALAAQNDLKGARRELDRCLQLDPGFQPAIELKNRLTSSP
ncbi:hypothetical protein DYH09_20370, partial [bacterium CPR1]|nr:hypothetical protein [bacterium CPR1]